MRHLVLISLLFAFKINAKADEKPPMLEGKVMAKPNLGILDTHTHFYDPTRPQGVPWPDKNDKRLYRPVLPE